jgi:hypothetical protein
MIDRRFLAGALGVLLGLTATEALAATKKKKTARKSHSRVTISGASTMPAFRAAACLI